MEIVEATLFLAVLAGLLSLVLIVVSKKFAVEENPLVQEIDEVLPQYNCGACGFPGCSGFAQHMADTKDPDGLCTPGGPEVQAAVAQILGMEVKEAAPTTAHVFCRGDNDLAKADGEYIGIADCIAADLISGGEKVCPYGCLGLGSCVVACDFDAIVVTNGIALIKEDACVACGRCIDSCPRKIIQMVPKGAKVAIECNSRDKGAQVKKYCKVGCTTCQLCAKNCPEEAVSLVDGNMVIDHEKCTFQGACIEACPQGCILALEGAVVCGVKAEEESA